LASGSTKDSGGKLQSVLENIEHGHHVFRACGKNAVLRMYEKFATFLRLADRCKQHRCHDAQAAVPIHRNHNVLEQREILTASSAPRCAEG
jgi:hypothetical protein